MVPAHWMPRLHIRQGWVGGPSLTIDAAQERTRVQHAATPTAILPPVDVLSRWTESDWLQLATQLAPSDEPDTIHEAMVRLILSAQGLSSAVRFATQLAFFHRDGPGGLSPGLHLLRSAIARASPAERRLVHQHLQYAGTSDVGQVRRSYLFPEDESWWAEAQRSTDEVLQQLTWLSAPNVGALPPLIAQLQPGVAETLLVGFGASVVPFLATWMQCAPDKLAEGLRQALMIVPDDRSIQALFTAATDPKEARKLRPLVERFPRRCRRVGVHFPTLQSLIQRWVPDSAKATELAAQVHISDYPPGEEVGLTELPSFFCAPPWRRRTPPSREKVPNLTAMLPPPSVHLTDIERAGVNERLRSMRSLKTFEDRLLYLLCYSGDPAERILLAKQFKQLSMAGAPARLNALTLAAERPGQAAPILLAARGRAPNIIRGLVALRAPEVASFFLNALSRTRNRPIALQWLERHPEYAARAWIPIAAGPVTKRQQQAVEGLQLLSSKGHTKVLHAIVADAYPKAKPALEQWLLRSGTSWPRRPSRSRFVTLEDLPRPKIRESHRAFSMSAMKVFVEALSTCRPNAIFPELRKLLGCCHLPSLRECAWALFEQWLTAGAPAKENWALISLGLFGDDVVVRRLGPLIQAWPGQSHHARAVIGLDVLVAIGGRTARAQLQTIAQEAKFKGLRAAAQTRLHRWHARETPAGDHLSAGVHS